MPDDVPPFSEAAAAGQAGFYENPDCRRVIAHFLADRDIYVFPLNGIRPTGGCTCPKGTECPSAGKHPLRDHWQEESTIDHARINAWFLQYPLMNYGVDLEKSGLFVVDVDNRPDGDGWDTLRAFLAKLQRDFPPTWTVRTGSDGVHYWFWIRKVNGEYPPLVKSLAMLGFGDHVDIQGKGKLVVAPGSRNAFGLYRFQGGEDGIDPLDADTDDDGRSGPAVGPSDVVTMLMRTSAPASSGPSGPVYTTVLGHLAALMGILRGSPTPGGHLPIYCPNSRRGGNPAGHGEGSETRTVLMGAQQGARLGGLHCFAASCTYTVQRWLNDVLTDRVRFPDGVQWLREIDATLDAAGIEPLSQDARAEAYRDTRDHGHGSSNGGPPPGDTVVTSLWLMQQGVRFTPATPKKDEFLIASPANLVTFLEVHPSFHGSIAHNQMTMQTTLRRPLPAFHHAHTWPEPNDPFLDPEDHATLAAYFESVWRTDKILSLAPTSTLNKAVQAVARKHSYSPLVEMIEGLPAWDGTPRLASWVTTVLGITTAVHCRMGELWLLQAVARVLDPGCQADLVLILQGDQGIGKNKLVRAMNAPFLAVQLGTLEKTDEAIRRCHAGWIIELGEMAVLKRVDIEKIKNYITCNDDLLRRFYTEQMVTMPRRFVLIGTTNRDDYLTDMTGNRRFLPLPIGTKPINVGAFTAIRDQLYAEARDRIRAGVKWWPDATEATEFGEEADEHVADDPWELSIRQHVANCPSIKDATTTEILTDWLKVPVERQDRYAAARLRSIMLRIGWKPDNHIGQKKGESYGARGYRNPDPKPVEPEREPGSDDGDRRFPFDD